MTLIIVTSGVKRYVRVTYVHKHSVNRSRCAKFTHKNNLFFIKFSVKVHQYSVLIPQVKPWAFKAILQYLYTDRLYIAMDDIDDCIRLAQQCKLEYLKCQLQMRLNSIEMFGMSMKACSIESGEGIELGTPSLSTLGLYELVRAITSS